MAEKSTVQAKILFDEGYSVLILGSAFHWEFVKSMPKEYRPGLPSNDASQLRILSLKIINTLEKKNELKFDKKILIGTSFGAMTALFTAAQDEKAADEEKIGISHCIAICPPIEIFFALNEVDKYSQDWKNNPADIKLRTAIAAEKIIEVAQTLSESKNSPSKTNNAKFSPEKEVSYNAQNLPFNLDEAKLTIGFIMKQKLSDVVFSIEDCSRCKKNKNFKNLCDMSYYDYAKKYLPDARPDKISDCSDEYLINDSGKLQDSPCGTGLYSIKDFLQNNKNYKIYHAIDDYFVSRQQLIWLKNLSKEKTVYFSNGSHLGYMYRPEFIDEFKKEIAIMHELPNKKL